MSSLVNSQCPHCGSLNQKPVHELYLRHMRLECANCAKDYSAKDHLRPLSSFDNTHDQSLQSNKKSEVDSLDFLDETPQKESNDNRSFNADKNGNRSKAQELELEKLPLKENERQPRDEILEEDDILERHLFAKHDKSAQAIKGSSSDSLELTTKRGDSDNEAKLPTSDSAAAKLSTRAQGGREPPRIKPITNPNFPLIDDVNSVDTKGLSSAGELEEDVRFALQYDDSFDDVVFDDEYRKENERRNPSFRLSRLILPMVLFAGVIVQTHYFWLNKLGQFDNIRPALEVWCQIANCTLAPLDSVSTVKIVQSRLNEQKNGNLKLQFTLHNSTRFPTLLPTVELHFSDIDQDIISNFHITAIDYSPFIETMKANEQISFSVEFDVDYPKKVSSYEIRVVSAYKSDD